MELIQASEMHSVIMPETTENGDDESETDRLICDDSGLTIPKKKSSKESELTLIFYMYTAQKNERMCSKYI